MHVIGHDHGSVKLVPSAVIVKAVLQHGIPGLGWKRGAIILAKGDE